VPYNPGAQCLCPACLKARIETIEAYDAVSDQYAEKYQDEILLKPVVQGFIGDFLQGIPGNEIICDMGCGPGQVARYLHRNLGRPAEGIDLSPKMIETASRINPDISFKCADILAMNETNLYAGIIGLYFIVNFPPEHLHLVFDKLFRLLKAGGKLLLSFHIGDDNLVRVESLWESGKSLNFYFFNPGTVSKALTNSGFTVTDVRFRQPDIAIEYNSQRAYVFASKA
jgi:SAM-dependent methyltransferase